LKETPILRNVLNGKRISWSGRRAAWQSLVAAGLVLGAAAACERAVTASGANPSANAAAVNAGSIGGRVVGLDGAPIAGAVVSTQNGQSAVAGADGSFSIEGLAPTDRLPVDVSAPGFATTSRIYRVVPGETLSREIRLIRQGAPVAIIAGEGGVVRFSDVGIVEVPANAFEGVSPQETVFVRVSYWDPADAAAFREAPGDFSGVEADGSLSVLRSNGMWSVSVTNRRGEELRLANGRALLTSLPNRVRGGGVTQPEQPCSWGVYRYDGSRWVLVGPSSESAPRQYTDTYGVRYNIDCWITSSSIGVRVVDAVGNPVRNLSVTASGVSYFGGAESWTDANGYASLPLGAGQQVSVRAGSNSVTLTTPPAGGSSPVTTIVF
jgi:hypothetical protein